MNDSAVSGVHWSFWIIGAVALVWNVMGAINFVMQMNPEAVATYPESHRAIIDGRPVWATAGFAVAVFGGVLGCLLLLFKKPAAFYVFVVSLLGVVATMIHTVRVTVLIARFSAFEIFLMVLLPLVVAAFLVWYSKWTERKGWVR